MYFFEIFFPAPVKHGNKTEKTGKIYCHNGLKEKISIVNCTVAQETNENSWHICGHDNCSNSPAEAESNNNPEKEEKLLNIFLQSLRATFTWILIFLHQQSPQSSLTNLADTHSALQFQYLCIQVWEILCVQ